MLWPRTILTKLWSDSFVVGAVILRMSCDLLVNTKSSIFESFVGTSTSCDKKFLSMKDRSWLQDSESDADWQDRMEREVQSMWGRLKSPIM